MANVTYTVVRGDTLSEIAVRYGTTTSRLATLNNIRNPDYIVVGQVLIISGTAAPTTTTTTSRATITVFGLQSNTDRTVYAAWAWSRSNTENYQVIWYYDTGDNIWFVGTDSTTDDRQSIYNAPSNAVRVKFKVKPISEKRTVNDAETSYWTASWSTERSYSFSNNPPTTPAVPTVSIDNYRLTAELENLDVNGTHIQFQIVKNDLKVFNTGTAKIVTTSASYSCNVDAGGEYKVRCRAVRSGLYSDWSAYSSNASTVPAATAGITKCKAQSETSVYLEWTAVSNATSYDLEYATELRYFDGSDQTSTVTSIEYAHYEKTGLESGQEYFFRVRAVNAQGNSAWSPIKSVVIGENPAAPTTWSSTTTCITGESLTLYWTHNSVDGSTQTFAEIQIYIGDDCITRTVNTVYEDDDEKTMYYTFDTTSYVEGTNIQWRVRTAGVTQHYGEWSIQRGVDIYAPPTLSIEVTNSSSESIETLTSFPFYISGTTGPNTQTPIGYHVSIMADETYETIDSTGSTIMVSAGDSVYSKHFDTSEQLLLMLSAGHVDLENNVGYTIVCVASMNSGLSVTTTTQISVAWTDEQYEPNAEIGIDNETLTAFIRPYCEDYEGVDVAGVTLSVYRREFDGSLIELASGIQNGNDTFVTDPHPALDYARYRIVAISTSTGAVSYYDVPGYPVGGKSVVIQWSETWSTFDTTDSNSTEQPPWSGSMLKLPYNIDVSDEHQNDVALVQYIGRKRPVSYYGTQLGETSSWNVEIEKSDKETLYALRRLSSWMGDVYVREPSGSGYWASITVSFSQTHCELTIPVSLNITRVTGGA